MVNLLKSGRLVELTTVTMDMGLDEQTTLNSWLCLSCYRWYMDNMIDVATGDCLLCVRVSPNDEGEEDENEFDSLMD